jgi:hypothetical protein
LEDEASDYLAINYARWDGSLPRLVYRQLSKKSFRTYKLANLEANRVGAMPIVYRLADAAPSRTAGPVRRRTLLAGAAVGLVAVVALRRMLRRTTAGVSL